MKQISIFIIILFFLSCYSKKDSSLCKNELSLISNTTDIAYIELDSTINYINKSVSNILGIDSLCGRDNSIGVPFGWEEGKFIKKGGIPINLYFENKCSTDSIEKRIDHSKLILINHRGDLLFEGKICNTGNLMQHLNNLYFWGMKGNHYRVMPDFFMGNNFPIDTMSLVIKKLTEDHLRLSNDISDSLFKKGICDLNKKEIKKIAEVNPLKISIVLKSAIPPPSLPNIELDTIIRKNQEIIPSSIEER